MANTTWYGDGTATVAVGSRTVTGTDTGWLTEVAGLTPIKVGDKFGIHVGRPIVIEQIISDTELLLADDWPGPAQTDAPYKVELTSPTIAAVEAMRRLLASLSNGNLDSLSEITVGVDDIPVGIGPGVFGTVNKFTLKDGVQFDVAVPNLAGRAAYNGAAANFRVLVANIGDGRSALYIKNSATSGDWSVPYPITGPVGPAGVNQRGNYSAGTAYAIRDIVQSGGSTWIAKVATTGNAPPTLPVTENTQWLLFARSGTPGVVDRGAYSGAAAYEANDIVLDNGSTWIALQPTTGNAPPTLPTESNAYWRILARKGTDGSGTGDVVGPAGGVVSGNIVLMDGSSGKLISDSGLHISSIAAARNEDDKIINGCFDIAQRGESQTVDGYGSVDRWSSRFIGGASELSRQAFVLGDTLGSVNGTFFVRQVVSGHAAVNNYSIIRHAIENVRSYAGQTVTLLGWARRSTGSGDMSVEAAQFFGTGGSPSATVNTISPKKIALSPVWSPFAAVMNFPPVSGKNIGTNGDSNVYFNFWTSAGSDFNSRTENLGLQSIGVDLFGLNIRKGIVPVDALNYFSPNPVWETSLACRRYYRSSGALSGYTSEGAVAVPRTSSSTQFWGKLYDGTMRAQPVVSVSSYNGTLNAVSGGAAGAPDITAISQMPSLSAGGGGFFAMNLSTGYDGALYFNWRADAEL
ncbi:hypothetical protein [Agrobacterium tumefaciens]|uniref:hypothetical protein n=1 Tax=Agrobacterium tumefaciens TaxID=358 RepID=UPI001F486274|nr:hypothetical protein [Agrobacterium tumefaciens]